MRAVLNPTPQRQGETALDIALARDDEEKAALLQRYGGKAGRTSPKRLDRSPRSFA